MPIQAPTTAGKRVNELIIKKGLSAEEAIKQVLGEISVSLPQGSQIINQSLNYVEYRDKEGYIHKVQRNADATSPDFGRINDQTDRPAVLPVTQQFPGLQETLNQATEAVRGGLSGQLKGLSPEDQALLQTIAQATQQQLNQRFEREGGELVSQLFGRGVQQSSLAGGALADLLQAQGLVQNQASSDAAARQLGLQQFLTQLSSGTGADILGLLTGQETQRGIASGQIAQQGRELDQRASEAARNFLLEFEKFQASQRRSPLGAILSGVGSLAAAIPGVGTAIGAGLSGLGRIITGSAGSGGGTGIPGYGVRDITGG